MTFVEKTPAEDALDEIARIVKEADECEEWECPPSDAIMSIRRVLLHARLRGWKDPT